jgi:chitosanase
MSIQLTDRQRRIIEQVVNVFETGTPRGDYGNISIYEDGPQNIRQITYGRAQTTEFGNLRELVKKYVEAGGWNSEELRPYLALIGLAPLVDDERFKDLLQEAGREDPIMRRVQDEFFDERYFQPAMKWAADEGFELPLSGLVIYDSFIHSGSILNTLREKFPECTPRDGGSEPAWTFAYVKTRHAWLANHYRPIVRKTTYRTSCLLHELQIGNWNLDLLPLMVRDIPVTGDELEP